MHRRIALFRSMNVLATLLYLGFVFCASTARFPHAGTAVLLLDAALRVPIYALLTVLLFLLVNAFLDGFSLSLAIACLLAASFGLLVEVCRPDILGTVRMLENACLDAAGVVIGGIAVRWARYCVKTELENIPLNF